MFFKIKKAKKLCRKALYVIYAERNAFRLWKDLSSNIEFFSDGVLDIQTIPNEYNDGANLPYITISYDGDVVLKAGAHGIGWYKPSIYHSGGWEDHLQALYDEVPRKERAYRKALKEKRKNDFAPL